MNFIELTLADSNFNYVILDRHYVMIIDEAMEGIRVPLKSKKETLNCEECPLKEIITWDAPDENLPISWPRGLDPSRFDMLCIYNLRNPKLLKKTSSKKRCRLFAEYRRDTLKFIKHKQYIKNRGLFKIDVDVPAQDMQFQ
jgi:bifunctional DNA-binding transcriptional regulator/antitoxin component of YhaV-PrlF toxin-antitoxin module